MSTSIMVRHSSQRRALGEVSRTRNCASSRSSDLMCVEYLARALQSTPAVAPLVRAVSREWESQRAFAMHRLEGRWAADDLAEMREQLLSLEDAYGGGDALSAATS